MKTLSLITNRKLISYSNLIIMAIGFGLIAAFDASAAVDQSRPQLRIVGSTDLTTPKPKKSFLKPLELRLIIPANDPSQRDFCTLENSHIQCPPILTSGGITSGGIPTIEPAFKANLPHVRVSFFIQEISNQVIANGGVETDSADDWEFVNWTTTGADADIENSGPYGWSLPAPGQTYDSFGPHGGSSGLMIYDALVFNACGSLSSFPVEHEGIVTESGAVIGSFSDTDNSTINSTGYYNLNYTVRATDNDGGVSDVHFSGKADVICSGLNSL